MSKKNTISYKPFAECVINRKPGQGYIVYKWIKLGSECTINIKRSENGYNRNSPLEKDLYRTNSFSGPVSENPIEDNVGLRVFDNNPDNMDPRTRDLRDFDSIAINLINDSPQNLPGFFYILSTEYKKQSYLVHVDKIPCEENQKEFIFRQTWYQKEKTSFAASSTRSLLLQLLFLVILLTAVIFFIRPSNEKNDMVTNEAQISEQRSSKLEQLNNELKLKNSELEKRNIEIGKEIEDLRKKSQNSENLLKEFSKYKQLLKEVIASKNKFLGQFSNSNFDTAHKTGTKLNTFFSDEETKRILKVEDQKLRWISIIWDADSEGPKEIRIDNKEGKALYDFWCLIMKLPSLEEESAVVPVNNIRTSSSKENK